jgi:hypothetical protein
MRRENTPQKRERTVVSELYDGEPQRTITAEPASTYDAVQSDRKPHHVAVIGREGES